MEDRSEMRDSGVWPSILVLLLAILGSAACYVWSLGFLHDDWAFQTALQSTPDHSWSGLYAALAEDSKRAVRPLQIAWYVLFEKLAPGAPQPPHLANQVMFALGAIGLFFAARQIRVLGPTALWLVLLYVCLPQFMTARFWYANHQSSISLFFFSLTALLVTVGPAARAPIEALRLAALFFTSLLGLLSYELFAFIQIALPLLIRSGNFVPVRDSVRSRATWSETAALTAALACVAAFKAANAPEMVLTASAADFAGKTASIYVRAAITTLGTLGVALPLVDFGVAVGPWFRPLALLPAMLLLATLMVLHRRLPRLDFPSEPTQPRQAARLALGGCVVFVLAYLPFVGNFKFGGSAFGIANRLHEAGALGIALLALAGAKWLSSRAPKAAELILVLFCAAGLFLQVTVGLLWDEAATIERRTHAQILALLGKPASGEAVLLFGLCPFHGPVPLYNYWWALSARLAQDYPHAGLRANTITPDFRLDAQGITTKSETGRPILYRYGNLRILDLRANAAHRISSREEAQHFFSAHPFAQANGCHFSGAAGVSMFGINALTGF